MYVWDRLDVPMLNNACSITMLDSIVILELFAYSERSIEVAEGIQLTRLIRKRKRQNRWRFHFTSVQSCKDGGSRWS